MNIPSAKIKLVGGGEGLEHKTWGLSDRALPFRHKKPLPPTNCENFYMDP